MRSRNLSMCLLRPESSPFMDWQETLLAWCLYWLWSFVNYIYLIDFFFYLFDFWAALTSVIAALLHHRGVFIVCITHHLLFFEFFALICFKVENFSYKELINNYSQYFFQTLLYWEDIMVSFIPKHIYSFIVSRKCKYNLIFFSFLDNFDLMSHYDINSLYYV